MRAFWIFLALLLVPFSVAQMFLYDLGTRRTSAVVVRPLSTLTNVFGSGRAVTFGAFAGTDSLGSLSSGFSGTMTFRFSDQADLVAGVGLLVAEDKRSRLGLFFGLRFF